MRKILVTGGAGYIGDAVVANLKTLHRPVVLDNLMYGGSYMRKVPFIRADITDYTKMEKIMKRHGGFDAVVHLAAIVGDGACAVNPGRTVEVNQKATEVIADLCKKTRTRLIFASTCSVYGANNELLDENSPTNPLSLYAATKLEAEKYIEDVLDDYVIFRLGTLFGMSAEHARIRSDLVANILTYRAALGETLTVFGGEQWRPLLHVRDAANQFVKAVGYPTWQDIEPGIYILAAENYTILELAKTIIKTVGKGTIETTSMKFEDLRNYRVSTKKIKESGQSTMIGLAAGIQEMAKTIMDGRIADIWSPEFHNAKYIGAMNG